MLKGFTPLSTDDNQHGVLVEITRPKIARKTEDYTPGGGMGEMTIVHGFEKLEMEITSKGYDADILRQMQSSAISGTPHPPIRARCSRKTARLIRPCRARRAAASSKPTPAATNRARAASTNSKSRSPTGKKTLDGEDVLEIDMRANVAIRGQDERAGLPRRAGI